MTNTSIQKFNFRNNDVRVLKDEQGEPWFVGKDVASVLGYTDHFGALKKHVDEEDKQNCQNDSFESPRGMTIINESGLYALVLSSKLPSAREFKHWVTSEVLPSIRKHGAYMTEQTIEQALTSPDFLIKLANQLKDEQAKRIKAENHAKALEPKARFADAVVNSKTNILVNDLAKILKSNGVNIGGYRLFAWLRDNGYLIKRKGTDYNMPTQKSMELGLFVVKETPVFHHDGHTTVSKTPKVTGKGQEYFVNKFLKQSEALMKQTLGQSSQPQSKVLEVK